MATTFCALLLVASHLAVASAHQKPTFRSGVEVILIDVNVVDRSHMPVSNLTADDFIVSVDHRRRKVVSAQFLRYDVRMMGTADLAPTHAPGTSAPSDVAPGPSPARNVLIVVDTDSMEPGDGLLLRREAGRLIDRLAPDDRVGVVTIPRMKSEVTLTKDRVRVKAELATVITGAARYRSPKYRIGLYEAFAAERDPDVLTSIQARECPSRDAWCRRDVATEVRKVQMEEHLRGERSLRALRDLGLALEKVAGPKTVLLVSGGTPRPDGAPGAWYSLIGDAFAAAQVFLYTLYVEQPEFGQVKYGASPTGAQDLQADLEGIENATSAAGGTLMEAIGTWDRYFDRILTELSGSYLLGIEVEPADRDGRPHQVSVKVQRGGVGIRARAKYVIQPEK
jgi:VWFA-related protein